MCPKIIHLPHPLHFFAICRSLTLRMPCTATFIVVSEFPLLYIGPLQSTMTLFLLISSYQVKLFCICNIVLSNNAFCALSYSTPWDYIGTCSLLTSLVFFRTVSSFIISIMIVFIIQAIYELFFQPSIIFLIFTVSGLISQCPCPFLSRFLTFFSLQHCKENMILLRCSLNFPPGW